MPRFRRSRSGVCEDLIFDRDDQALARFIQFFEEHGSAARTERADPTEGMTAAQRAHWKIVHRKKEGIEQDIDTVIAERIREAEVRAGIHDSALDPARPSRDAIFASPFRNNAAVDVLNTVLLPAMKEVGDLFGAGQLILPFVLQSAEVMKKSGCAPGAVSGKTRRGHQRQDRPGDGIRRCPRHRQESGSYDPRQQRVYRV
jgi:5-methyltetrahydrofolate--homocysteine methyltransferase